MMDPILKVWYWTSSPPTGLLCFALAMSLSSLPPLSRQLVVEKRRFSTQWKNSMNGWMPRTAMTGESSMLVNDEDVQWWIACWIITRYYKGLGTSTAKEGKEYFSQLDKHIVPFGSMTGPEEDLLDMCFRRRRCEERKQWMNEWTEDRVVDYSKRWMIWMMLTRIVNDDDDDLSL